MDRSRSQQTNLFEVLMPPAEVPAGLRARAVELIKVLLVEALAGATRQIRTVARAEGGIASAREVCDEQDHA
jgi:hypothetical protein